MTEHLSMLMGASLQPWGAALAGWCDEMQSRPLASKDAGFVLTLEKQCVSPWAAAEEATPTADGTAPAPHSERSAYL